MGEMTEHERMVRDDTAQWMNPDDLVVPEDMPRPMLWRLLVAPIKPARKSKGGIVLPDESVDNVELLTNICKVLSMGPLCGRKPEWPEGVWDVKVGDLVVIAQYAGQRFEFKGVKAVLIDDDAIMAKAPTAEGFRVYL